MSKIHFAHLAAALAALCAGTAVVATRFVIAETDPLTLVFGRYFVAVLCLAPFLPLTWSAHKVTFGDYAKIAIFGTLFFVLFPWGFNASLKYIPAARGAVGLATIPIQTLIVATLFGRETLSPIKVLGVALAFAGIAVAFGTSAFSGGGTDTLKGDVFMLAGVFCAAVYSVFSRPTLMRHGPLFVTTLAMAFAVLLLLPFVVIQHGVTTLPDFSTKGWMAVVFLGSVGGAFQFSLFMWALRWLPPTTTVLYLTLNPIAAVVLGILLLGEQLTVELCIGMVLVLVGIVVGANALPFLRKPQASIGPAKSTVN